jgi:hypothetical protein
MAEEIIAEKEHKVIQLPTRPQLEHREAPEDARKMTFSVEDFDVEQLPEKKDKKESVEEVLKTDPKNKEIKEDDSTNKDDKGGEKNKEQEEVVVEQGKEDASVVEDESKTKGLPKGLKPPVTALKEEVVEGGEKKEVIKKITPVQGKVQRDYTGHTDEEVTAFKKMSDEGYTFTKKLITENKELAKLKGSTYLQHEQAYVLDPDFQKMQTDQYFANKEASYWKDQLILMDLGKPWKPIERWDQQGNPVLGAERQPTKADEEQVRMYMNNSFNVANQLSSAIQQYPSRYKDRVKNDMSLINQERANRFAWVSDPKLLDHTVNIEGLGDRSIKQVREDFAKLFPEYLRPHPAVEIAADLMVSLRLAQGELAELQNGKTVESIKEKEQEKVEPSSRQKPRGEGKKTHGVTEFSALPESL